MGNKSSRGNPNPGFHPYPPGATGNEALLPNHHQGHSDAYADQLKAGNADSASSVPKHEVVAQPGPSAAFHSKGGAQPSQQPAQQARATVPQHNDATPHAAPQPIPARKAGLEDFVLLKTVGKGSFGKVVMVRKKDDGRIYAMKILKKDMVLKRKQYEHTLAERRILENIDHPFIVSLRFAFQSEHKLYMVFDFFNGGELYHYLSEGGRFTEERARFYAAEIVSALDYMHKRGIVYRDLKPENLILDSQGHIKITDFGLSKEGVDGDTITSICGTPEYLAPEILRKRPYGVAVDWWSLGTLLYEMIAGLPPFYDRNRQVMYRKILEAPLEPPASMSAEAADICSKMLVREPTARLGYRGAEEIMTHPFFRPIDFGALQRKAIPPPWRPQVRDAADTRNISSEFTNEPAAVTPSPMGSRLRDMTGTTPPSFTDFTFTQKSALETHAGTHRGQVTGPAGAAAQSGARVQPAPDNYRVSLTHAERAAVAGAGGVLPGPEDEAASADGASYGEDDDDSGFVGEEGGGDDDEDDNSLPNGDLDDDAEGLLARGSSEGASGIDVEGLRL